MSNNGVVNAHGDIVGVCAMPSAHHEMPCSEPNAEVVANLVDCEVLGELCSKTVHDIVPTMSTYQYEQIRMGLSLGIIKMVEQRLAGLDTMPLI